MLAAHDKIVAAASGRSPARRLRTAARLRRNDADPISSSALGSEGTVNTPVILLAWALLTATSSLASQRSAAIIDDPAYTRVHRLVAVDGKRRLNLYCTGEGSPTVLFDSGLGGNTIQWGLVQPLVAAHTRACSYDRAGLGFSDAASSTTRRSRC